MSTGEQSIDTLIDTVRELSAANTLSDITSIVTRSVRTLVRADGATFVLKDSDRCFYVDEDAVTPLWKGKKFPLSACISGWTMLHQEVAIIEDIYTDERIPHEAYEPTFVKSLAMVPIRKEDPLASLGAYWGTTHEATANEVKLLQAVADAASVALQNLELHTELNRKISELESTNYELSRYSWVASHDIREPLRSISSYLQLIEQKYGTMLDDNGRRYLDYATAGSRRLQKLVKDLLEHTHLITGTYRLVPTKVDDILRDVFELQQPLIEEIGGSYEIGTMPTVRAAPILLYPLFMNLISNSLKFRSDERTFHLDITAELQGGNWHFTIQDNGIGIAEEYHQKIFGMFERLHCQDQYEGSGLGLAVCDEIVKRLGGTIWVESVPTGGARFRFTIPALVPGVEEPASYA